MRTSSSHLQEWSWRRPVAIVGAAAFIMYVAALLAIGAIGLVVPEVELRWMYQTTLDDFDEHARVVILHQYRFLKACTFDFGLWAIVLRKRIVTQFLYLLMFLAVLYLAVGARLLSWILYGSAGFLLISFTFSEVRRSRGVSP